MHRFDPRIYLFTVGHFAIDWAQGAIPALLPYFIATCGWSYQDAGTIVFANILLSSILQPVFGYYSDRVSRPWFAPLGTFSVGGNAGFAVGPLFAGFCAYVVGIEGLLFYAVFNTAVALILHHRMPGILRDMKEQQPVATANGATNEAKNDWRSFGKLTILIFARSIGFDGCNAFLPLYLIRVLSATAATGSFALTILFALGAVITYFGGILADRLGYVRVLRVSFFVMIPAMFLLVNNTSLTAALLLLPLVAFSLFAPYSSAVVLGRTYLSKNIGFASGVTLGLTTTFGGLVTPLIGRAADTYGIAAALQCLWLVAIFGALCSFALRTPDSLKQPKHCMV